MSFTVLRIKVQFSYGPVITFFKINFFVVEVIQCFHSFFHGLHFHVLKSRFARVGTLIHLGFKLDCLGSGFGEDNFSSTVDLSRLFLS